MKIDIVIKDVSVEIAQQIFALIGGDTKVEQVTRTETETIKTDAHLPFSCEWCGRKFKSQNSVNSHLKYCEDKPAKKEEKVVVEEPPKQPKHPKKARQVKTPVRKKKDPPKPSFVAPNDSAIKEAVVTSVLANGTNISSSAGISHEIVAGLRKAQGASSELNKFAQNLELTIAGYLKAIEKSLGVGVCMGMPLPDGYQIAVFDNKGLTKAKLLKSL